MLYWFNLKRHIRLGSVAHLCDSSTQEAEAGGWRVGVQTGLSGETICHHHQQTKGLSSLSLPCCRQGLEEEGPLPHGSRGVGAPSLPLPGLPCLRRLPAANRGPIHSCLRRATEHFPTACLGSQTPGSQGVIFLRADFFKFHFLPSCWCPTPISS